MYIFLHIIMGCYSFNNVSDFALPTHNYLTYEKNFVIIS